MAHLEKCVLPLRLYIIEISYFSLPSSHFFHRIVNLFRGVVQPGSTPALGAGGRRFKSGRPEVLFTQNP
jgi:hypothetical protein